MQILHIDSDHWIAVSNIGCTTKEDIIVYDSIYTSISAHTKQLLSQLVHTDKPAINVKIAPTPKQSGSSDCGVYAVAFVTSIAFGLDPSLSVYNQTVMRGHLLSCLELKVLSPFPISGHKRLSSAKHVSIKVYCYCRCTENGKMIMCDGQCGQWFHFKCIHSESLKTIKKNEKWFCNNCSST